MDSNIKLIITQFNDPFLCIIFTLKTSLLKYKELLY